MLLLLCPQDPENDGATRVLAFNHGYSREILLDNEEVAAIREDIQTVRMLIHRPIDAMNWQSIETVGSYVNPICQPDSRVHVRRKLRESARARSWHSNCRPRQEKPVPYQASDTSSLLSILWRAHAVHTLLCMGGTSTNSRSPAIGMKN